MYLLIFTGRLAVLHLVEVTIGIFQVEQGSFYNHKAMSDYIEKGMLSHPALPTSLCSQVPA